MIPLSISHLKTACCYLKKFLRLLWLKGRQEELVCFSLKSVTLQSHQGKCMQEFTRPIHLSGVLRGTWTPPAKGSNPLPPQQHGEGTRTLHRSFLGRTQCHSSRAPAGTALELGVMLRSPGFTGTQEKKSWEQWRVCQGAMCSVHWTDANTAVAQHFRGFRKDLLKVLF